jgi:uncharacterized spore protein YtfJ
MDEEFNDIVASTVKTQEQSREVVEKLFAVAQPGAVYSEPVTAGDYTVITATEVSVAMGFGFGIGGGTAPEEGGTTGLEEAGGQEREASGMGGGGGGGGISMGRPVAVISIGPGGVRVEPVRDVTKIGLALLTTAGAMLMMLSRMRRASQL